VAFIRQSRLKPQHETMKRAIKKRALGKHGPTVSSIGLGAMGVSDFYGNADRTESIATIHAVLDAGINFIDTGDFCLNR
jgi:aryl-alcohol dehydrogenase-like predicted oxidoreductase